MGKKYELFSLLREWGVIPPAPVLDENGKDLYNSLKAQKAGYFLHYFGVKPFSDFKFETVFRGPYEEKIAKSYYNGAPIEFEADRRLIKKLYWFMNHPVWWIELASYIMLTVELYPGIRKNGVLIVLKHSVPWLKEPEFDFVFEELRAKKLIPRPVLKARALA